MLEIRALTKRFGRQVAVDGFDLDCGANEFLVIFGPAGAGKSTALKMVAGILAPSWVRFGSMAAASCTRRPSGGTWPWRSRTIRSIRT